MKREVTVRFDSYCSNKEQTLAEGRLFAYLCANLCDLWGLVLYRKWNTE